jgi:hypothetical protein
MNRALTSGTIRRTNISHITSPQTTAPKMGASATAKTRLAAGITNYEPRRTNPRKSPPERPASHAVENARRGHATAIRHDRQAARGTTLHIRDHRRKRGRTRRPRTWLDGLQIRAPMGFFISAQHQRSGAQVSCIGRFDLTK